MASKRRNGWRGGEKAEIAHAAAHGWLAAAKKRKPFKLAAAINISKAARSET